MPPGQGTMAGLRHGRPTCIRAAFSATSTSASTRAGLQRRPWSTLRRVKAGHIKNFVEGIRREFLDPSDGEADDAPGPVTWSPGPLRGASCLLPVSKTRGAEVTPEEPVRSKCPDLVSRSARGGPEVADVDMQPVEACDSPADMGMGEEGPSDGGRQAQGRARVSPRVLRPLRLGAEKDKGPKLARCKRKLDLLLAEPERRKRKKPRAA